MKETFFKKMVCILLGICFLVPATIITTLDVKGDGGRDNIYCWREGESWDWSYDNNSGNNWEIVSDDDHPLKPASNGYSTLQDRNQDMDHILWDFTVYEPGYYQFWIRAWCNDSGTDEVALYWNDQFVYERSFYSNSYNKWYWFDFPETGSFSLSSGKGTLRIESNHTGLMEIDNIVITNDLSLNPPWYDKGKETGHSGMKSPVMSQLQRTGTGAM